jgi:hypothetical protein
VTRAEPADAAAVAAVARRAGMRVERTGATHLDVIVAAVSGAAHTVGVGKTGCRARL